MAESQAQARNSVRFTQHVARGLRESALIAIGVVAIVLFVALASYSPDDPGFSFTGSSAVVHNRIGPIGAWVADASYFLFGFSVWWCVAAAVRAWVTTLMRWTRGESVFAISLSTRNG